MAAVAAAGCRGCIIAAGIFQKFQAEIKVKAEELPAAEPLLFSGPNSCFVPLPLRPLHLFAAAKMLRIPAPARVEEQITGSICTKNGSADKIDKISAVIRRKLC